MLNDAEHQDLQSEVEHLPVMAGTEVFDVNGHKVGKVRDRGLQPDALIVEKGMFFQHDVYIPLSAIQARLIDGIHLNVSNDDISSQNWGKPPTEAAAPSTVTPTATPLDARDQLAEPPDTSADARR